MSTAHSTDGGKLPSGRAFFLARHRRELKVLAQVGSGLCVIRGGLALFRLDRTIDWTALPLALGFLALYYCAKGVADPRVRNDTDWLRVPSWFRRVFPPGLVICYAIVVAVAFANIFTGWPSDAVYHLAVVTASSGLFALLYAHLALFFAYGELRKDPAEEEAQRDPDQQ